MSCTGKMADYKIYYFPYAGASSLTFKQWNKMFGEEIDFIAFDYPGHGKRNKEAFAESVQEICEELYELILEDNTEQMPYVLAGHCLGGIVALELYYMILEKGELSLPERLFISGHGAPDKIIDEGLTKMTSSEILEYLNKIGIVQDAMMTEEAREFTEGIYVPPIRSDAEIYCQYEWEEGRSPVLVPLTIQYGERDWKCKEEEILRWGQFAEGEIHYIKYPTGHYFITEITKQVIADMKEDILGKC